MKPTALVVDDNPDIAALFATCLSISGIETKIAPNIRLAKELLLKYPFAAMLVDFNLGDGKGSELIHAPGVPPVRILVSGTKVCQTTYPGFQAYLVKPVACPDLIDSIHLRLKEKVSA